MGGIDEYTTIIIQGHQTGFIKGCSATDHIFILKEVISICWEYNKEFSGLFTDFSKGCDILSRERI